MKPAPSEIAKPLANRNAEWARITMRMLIEKLQAETGSSDIPALIEDAQDRLFAIIVRYVPMINIEELREGLVAAERDVTFLAYEHGLQPSVVQ